MDKFVLLQHFADQVEHDLALVHSEKSSHSYVPVFVGHLGLSVFAKTNLSKNNNIV